MTPERAAQQLERFAYGMGKVAEAVLTEALAVAKERAVWWSSGPLSTAQLRKMGHPYARRAPQAGLDPGRINRQTGEVVAGWQVSAIRAGRGVRSASVYNTAPEARFLYDTSDNPRFPDRGTRLMVGRPLPERVIADLQSGAAAERITAAFDKALGG